MRMTFAAKEAEISHLKLRNKYLLLEEPGASEELKDENKALKAHVTALTGEVKEMMLKSKITPSSF